MSLVTLGLLLTLVLPYAHGDEARVEPTRPPERPSIVVFYIDDAAPHDGRLWRDPVIAPTIRDLFVDRGIEFTNAIAEDPLCCPARGNLLTGLHTHNNGVDTNDIRLFNPRYHVGTALRDSGYKTLWLGKYLNKPDALPSAAWSEHFAAWDHLEVTFGSNSRIRTSGGMLYFPDRHATQIVAERAAEHIAATPSDKPLFAVVSLFNMHAPNVAVPQPADRFALCDTMRPWSPPNYNEADVSDKPAYVRNRPLLSAADGWPMQKYCREMLGIDDAVQEVTDALRDTGRIENTLFVFTADNGMTWGAHRLGQLKRTPYSTPVPLFMSWASRWGNSSRVIDSHVSNIDLAPTFCEVGGCALGPYPTGQQAPDGISLMPLIDSAVVPARDALLEGSPVGEGTIPAWRAVRTTTQHPLGLWHYVEYATGELELYDLSSDPHELSNLAGDPAYDAIRHVLAARLSELRQEGRVNRPDLSVASLPAGKYGGYYVGYNVFDDDATARQTVRRLGALKDTTYLYDVILENNATGVDSFLVRATTTGTQRMVARYFADGVDVTEAVTGPGLAVEGVLGEGKVRMTVSVYVKPRAARGMTQTIALQAASSSMAGRIDTVRIITQR